VIRTVGDLQARRDFTGWPCHIASCEAVDELDSDVGSPSLLGRLYRWVLGFRDLLLE